MNPQIMRPENQPMFYNGIVKYDYIKNLNVLYTNFSIYYIPILNTK